MSELFFPFDYRGDLDNDYTGVEVSRALASIMRNQIVQGLIVSFSSGVLSVSSGSAWLNGCYYENTDSTVLPFTPPAITAQYTVALRLSASPASLNPPMYISINQGASVSGSDPYLSLAIVTANSPINVTVSNFRTIGLQKDKIIGGSFSVSGPAQWTGNYGLTEYFDGLEIIFSVEVQDTKISVNFDNLGNRDIRVYNNGQNNWPTDWIVDRVYKAIYLNDAFYLLGYSEDDFNGVTWG